MIPQTVVNNTESVSSYPGFNEIWDFYQESNFLYLEKKTLLLPYLKEISSTWDKLLSDQNNLFRFLYKTKNNKISSSICSAQYSQHTASIFHTTGINDPKGVCENTIRAIRLGIQHPQCYYGNLLYRPSNRFAERVIKYVKNRLPKEAFEHHTYDYYISNLATNTFEVNCNNGISVQYLKPEDREEFENILKNRHSPIYLNSKGLLGDDIFFKKTSKNYSDAGLFRTREILLLKDHNRIIAYSTLEYSSLAINFSFFFNSFTITSLEEDLNDIDLLIKASLNYYIKRGRSFAVCLAENLHDDIITKFGIEKKKEYSELILSKENNGFTSAIVHFENLYEHYFKFLTSFLSNHNIK